MREERTNKLTIELILFSRLFFLYGQTSQLYGNHIQMSILAEILSSRVRAEIFRLMFGLNPGEFYLRELERLAGFTIGTIQTEVKKLSKLDLIKKRRDGNRLYYRADVTHPLFPDIQNMVLKTIGLRDVFKEALLEQENIQVAFIFGSIANQTENAGSDIDLMVLGDISLRQLITLLGTTSERLGREINPHVLTREEFINKSTAYEPFLTRVLQAPKLFIIGTQSDLEAMA